MSWLEFKEMRTQEKFLNSTVIGVLIFGYIGALPFFANYGLVPAIFRTQHIAFVGDFFLAIGAFRSVSTIRAQNKLPILVFAGLLLFMFIKSFYQESKIEYYVLDDLRLYLRFFFMFWIGYQWADFNRIKKAMMVIMVLGILLNLLSLGSVSTLLRAHITEKPLVYQIQYLLIPSTFYILLFQTLTRREKIIVLAAFSLCALEQILFQKRLPTARIAMTLFAFYYVTSIMKRNFGSFVIETSKKITLLLGIFGISSILLLLIGFNVGIYLTALSVRYTGRGGNIKENLEEDQRWKIGEIFYADLEKSGEMITGRGFGGVVYNQTFHMKDDYNRGFRAVAEMGIPAMMLKGGILLVIYFSMLLLIILWRFRLFKDNVFSFAIWTHAFIWFVFLYPEGFIVNIASPDEMLVAYSLGACISNKSLVLIRSRRLSKNEI